MLYTKFRRNWVTGSGEEYFDGYFTIYGHISHLGHVTNIILLNFNFLVPKSVHTKFG